MQLQILIQVALALGLGALVGLERELANKPAGFRTHMLVGASATLLMAAGDVIVENIDPSVSQLRVDPIRVLEAVVTGVSFLGAGTIIHQRDGSGVEGLTTAASLLFIATVGILVGLEQYILAVGATLLALLVLRGGHFIERWLPSRKSADE